jgi:diguanylate cyclase (GGDEF)-like protein
MNGSYDGFQVLLSLCVAVLASYTALTLAGRIAAASAGLAQRVWLIAGASVMGIGIWSMHFLGMLAFSLPIPTGYAIGLTTASLFAAVAASYLALHVASRPILSWRRLILGGTLMAVGIIAMHYLGMEAMNMRPAIRYDIGLVLLSIVIALIASIAALWIAHALLGNNHKHFFAKRIAASLVMAVAIAGMHYTGMQAATFLPGSVCLAVVQGGLSSSWLAFVVGGASLGLLIVTLIISAMESRFAASQLQLSGSVDKLNLKLQHMAMVDALTNLPNRSNLISAAQQAIERARDQGRLCGILFIDLDGFKTINDSLGHDVGDDMLRAFAQRLRGCVRRTDLVARLGGDEFVVVLESLSNADDAGKTSAAICTAMQEDLVEDGMALHITPSIGIAMYPRDAEDVDVLLRNADIAMYESKQAGGNTFRFYEPALGTKAARTLNIQRGLQEAIKHDRFVLHFQPKFNGRTRQLTGAEALIRWQHPALGLIAPEEFIPVAERSGQIIEIGSWVMRNVCEHLRAWDADGTSPVKIAINLSPVQLRQPTIVQNMKGIADAAGIDPARIMFEITETVAMKDADLTARVIAEFHAAGFHTAIDDFGTGYSSLAYLQQFRVQQLKIDRFFTNGLDVSGAEGRAMVSAIVALAHSLNMEVVAEGVETSSQLDALRLLNCDQVQGFLLEHPLPADEFVAFLARQSVDGGGLPTAANSALGLDDALPAV